MTFYKFRDYKYRLSFNHWNGCFDNEKVAFLSALFSNRKLVAGSAFNLLHRKLVTASQPLIFSNPLQH